MKKMKKKLNSYIHKKIQPASHVRLLEGNKYYYENIDATR